MLMTLSPHRMKQMIREGIGPVLLRNGKNILPRDLAIAITSEDFVETRRNGFLG